MTKEDHDDLLFLTQLLVGFFGLLCLGELVYPNSLLLVVKSRGQPNPWGLVQGYGRVRVRVMKF